MSRVPILALGAIAFALGLAACDAIPISSKPGDEDMLASRSFSAPAREVVWEVVKSELSHDGFSLDELQSNPGAGRFETSWVDNLAPYRYEGKRKKILGRIEEEPGHPGTFRVMATTWVQKNASVKAPMDPAEAIWQDDTPDDGLTESLLYRIRQHFEP